MKQLNRQSGYIALVALLIVAAAGLAIGIAVSLAGIEETQLGFADSVASQAKWLANSCVEDGLERLRNNWSSYSGTLSAGPDSCTISTSVNGTTATLTGVGTVGTYTQKIQQQVDSELNVIAWQEE